MMKFVFFKFGNFFAIFGSFLAFFYVFIIFSPYLVTSEIFKLFAPDFENIKNENLKKSIHTFVDNIDFFQFILYLGWMGHFCKSIDLTKDAKCVTFWKFDPRVLTTKKVIKSRISNIFPIIYA